MKYKKSRELMWIGFGIGILIMILGTGFDDEGVTGGFVLTGTLIFFAALVQAFIFYVCPHCGYSLMNVRGKTPDYCPKCGEQLKVDI